MAEPKPLASLTSGLLARKGAARPAMRRQAVLGVDGAANVQDDLGWNDMGYDVNPGVEHAARHASGLSPMVSHEPADVLPLPGAPALPEDYVQPEPAVIEQRRRVQALETPHVERPVEMPVAAPVAASPVAVRARRPRAEAGAKGRFAFTLRLDGERHLLLRLASAATNKSAQQILIGLVDDYFAGLPAVTAMAAQIGDQSSRPHVSGDRA